MGRSLTVMVWIPVSNERYRLTRILGRFLYEDLIPNRNLADTVSFLEGEEKEAFLDLVKGMLHWHLNWRKTAGELARHPFLQLKGASE